MTRPQAPRTFTTAHPASSTLRYHHHGIAFATIVLEGCYTEVRESVPLVCPAGTLVIHDAHEEHADYFTQPTRCLNLELDEPVARGTIGCDLGDDPLRAALNALAALRARSGGASGEPEWLQPTLDRFEWSGAEPLRGAARVAGLHPTHFSRAFRRHVGTTPNGYRLRARVRRASALLLETNASLASIALACGFSDQSHLTRTFGAALGLAPAAYRRTFAR
jgi:AraC-like DNA-binding protein